jgi:hypothetical protein
LHFPGRKMKLNEHERPRPNNAGLSSLGQQAEMKILLAGSWPPLKPLPVFKYEAAEYRVSIEFDKARGEWVCRKTSLPLYKVEELRGGLPGIILALPHGQAEAFAGCAAAGQQEQELDKEASRRLQAILEWKVNFENGSFYAGLQDYLSESQQREINDILRLTLTARQLQFSPKNVAYVFEALSKAGGRLATLIELAQRNKTQQGTDPVANVETAALDAVLHAPVTGLIPTTVEDSQEEQIGSIFAGQDQSSSPELTEHAASKATEIVPPGILDVDTPPFVGERQEKPSHHAPGAGWRPQVRIRKVESSTNRVENSFSRQHVLEISGFHIAAFAVVFLFAVISLPIGLTVGRGPLGQWLRDTQQSIFGVHVAPPALPNHPDETTSNTSVQPSADTLVDSDSILGTNTLDGVTRSAERSRESAQNSESFAKAPSTVSNLSPAMESKPSLAPDSNLGRDGSAGLIAPVAPPPASPKPAPSFKAAGSPIGTWRYPAPRRIRPSTGASPHRSPPSGILVTAPAPGSKSFRVSFPEKPIAASSSFAMTSELSVLVPPEPGPAATHKSARLQAGELVYFVWPRYPRQGDRHGSAETVRVRTTVGQLGQVLDIKLLSGSSSLFPATTNAIRLWRYRPTFLNSRPIAVQQDITIEFRPPRYLSQVRTQHPPHN